MTRAIRIRVLGSALLGLGALLAWAVAGLPAFGDYRGPYGYLLDGIVVPLRHTSNVVMATTFDVRGIDTMGEEFILYAAVVGVTLLLRDERERSRASERSERLRSDGIRLLGVLMIGGGVLVGLWLIAFGYITPGGGFQGGVVVAGGLLLLWIVGSQRDYEPFRNQEVLDPTEALGVGGYVVIGLAALASGVQFLTNLFGYGTSGTLLSSGSIAVLNWATGIAVTAAVLLLCGQFLATHHDPLPQEVTE